MLEANPNLTPAEVKEILQVTASPLPGNFKHEVGAGVLNTHAAVLQSAFPNRKIGLYRSILSNDNVKFKTSVLNSFQDIVNPGSTRTHQFAIPENTVQAGINISWGMSVNDLGLKLFNAQNNLVGNSNNLNLPGLTGNREKLSLKSPAQQIYRADIRHTLDLGTAQRYFGAVEVTQVQYSGINDLDNLSPQLQEVIKESLRTFMVSPRGSKFKPNSSVSRAELAESLVRSGRVLQYVAESPMFPDVRDLTTRNAVESVQSDRLFFDAEIGNNFQTE